MILGCDAAGVDEDGNEVVVHSVIGQSGHGVGPREPRSILTERYQGTFAEQVAVPTWNVLPKPKELSFERGGLPADRVADRLPDAVHQRRGAARRLGAGAGRRRRGRHRRDRAGEGGGTAGLRDQPGRGQAPPGGGARRATRPFEPGARLPQRVDAVIETVGAATWSHSVKSLRPGGTLVISGATSGPSPASAELNRIFFLELKVVGSTMGTKDELEDLLNFCATTGVRPVIDSVLPLDRAREGFEKMAGGDLFGKVVLTV